MNHASMKLLLLGCAITAMVFDIFLIFACLIDGYVVHWSLVLAMFFLISVILLALIESPKRERNSPAWEPGREPATPTYIVPRAHQTTPFVAQSAPRATRSVSQSTPKMPPPMPRNDR